MAFEWDVFSRSQRGRIIRTTSLIVLGVIPVLVIAGLYLVYTQCRIDVPAKHLAVLTKKTGEDLENSDEVAPDQDHKGLQLEVLPEGRYFYNPYNWSWQVYPMIEIPREKMGVRTLSGSFEPTLRTTTPTGRTSA